MSWSSSDTCRSQIDALARAGLQAVVGPTYHDCDDLDDVFALEMRLNLTAVPPCERVAAWFGRFRGHTAGI